MKYTLEMDSGAVIYIPSFIKISSAIRKLVARDMQTGWRSNMPTLRK
jgi:hypothetical protein